MGTILYGFPAQSRLTRTVNGIPDFETIDENTYRTVKLELTWCAPVHGPQPDKPKAEAIARGGWSAACVPYSNLGNHTLITDRAPARSEEPTSALQSLMRISYAVFCLKKQHKHEQ